MALLKKITILAGLVALASAPVSAQTISAAAVPSGSQTFNFVGPHTGEYRSSLVMSAGGITTTLVGYSFSNSLVSGSLAGANLSSFTNNVQLSYSDRGIGVCSPTETGGNNGNSEGCPEIDSSNESSANALNVNEGMLVTFTGAPTVNILGAALNIVDRYDTLGVYGVSSSGMLTLLGFGGTITQPGTGFTSIEGQTNTNEQYALTFSPVLSGYSRYLFTTIREPSSPSRGDGYRLASLTVADPRNNNQVPAVPEPATWAMMLLGFGGVGFQLRRRRKPTSITTKNSANVTC